MGIIYIIMMISTASNLLKNCQVLLRLCFWSVKLCSMPASTTFIMNSGYHLTESVYSFPFVILGDDWSHVMDAKSYHINGNAVFSNGAWINYNTSAKSGETIWFRAINTANATVDRNVNRTVMLVLILLTG